MKHSTQIYHYSRRLWLKAQDLPEDDPLRKEALIVWAELIKPGLYVEEIDVRCDSELK